MSIADSETTKEYWDIVAGVFDPPIFFRGGKADETGHGHALIVLWMPYEVVLQ